MRIATVAGWQVHVAVIAALAGTVIVEEPDVPVEEVEPPPWFGDATLQPRRVAGTVIGADGPMTVVLLADVPDPAIWPGRRVLSTASGEFDFGELRPGPYLIFAFGGFAMSRSVQLDTLREPEARAELFVYDRGNFDGRIDETFGPNFMWGLPYRFATALGHYPARDTSPITGHVLRHDGWPAREVGVQPIVNCFDDAAPQYTPEIATTAVDGSFRVDAAGSTCGFRIWMAGGVAHELRVTSADHYVIELPPSGREDALVLEKSYRYERDDPRGAWIRGRVVRNGAGVGDAGVDAYVLPHDHMEVFDDARTRRDGSFALYISSRDLERDGAILVFAGHPVTRHAGRRVVRVHPGETLEDVEIEIGNHATIAGVVVDERGTPVPDVFVSCHGQRALGVTTGIDGAFELLHELQGQCRLSVLPDYEEALAPVEGIPPKIDIVRPDEIHRGVRLVVRSTRVRAQTVSYGHVDLGFRLDDNDLVRAVADEAEAAGLRVGDRILGAWHDGSAIHERQLDGANIVQAGRLLELDVQRHSKRFVLRMRARSF